MGRAIETWYCRWHRTMHWTRPLLLTPYLQLHTLWVTCHPVVWLAVLDPMWGDKAALAKVVHACWVPAEHRLESHCTLAGQPWLVCAMSFVFYGSSHMDGMDLGLTTAVFPCLPIGLRLPMGCPLLFNYPRPAMPQETQQNSLWCNGPHLLHHDLRLIQVFPSLSTCP
jgi:hypothetical protein